MAPRFGSLDHSPRAQTVTRELVTFTAACPCGRDAMWTSQAVHSSPWPHHGSPTLITRNEIECDFCDTPLTATTMAA